jgi:hypothetical protein
MNAPYYPVDALPPIIRNAVLEVQAETKAPMALVVSVVLSAVSTACQNSINVCRPNIPASSCSLNVLIIALSGERKSAVTKMIFQAVREFQEREAEKSKLKLKEYNAKLAAWNIGQKVILAAMEKHEKKHGPNDQLTLRLIEHVAKEPQKPLIPKLLYSDVTPEALLYGLSEWPSAGLISDEAGSVLNGRVTNDLGTLNKLWDGTTQSTDRRGAGSIVVKEPRLTVLLAIQEKPLRQFLDRRGDEARDMGFLARYLVACPDSTQGTRFIGHQIQSTEYLAKFHDRITAILNKNAADVEQGSFIKHILGFMPDAELRWVKAYNNIELDMAPGGYLSDINEYAAKIAENIARMAALFHFFEGGIGDISLDAVNRAVTVCEWHGAEFKRLFSLQSAIPIEQADAQLLERWLFDFVWKTGRTWIKKNEVRQCGPNTLRNKVRLDNAINFLILGNKIYIGVDNKKGKYINLYPQHFQGYTP